MPYTRISLRKGQSAQYLQALSDSVHQAMVEAFDVPPDDRFQIIHQHEPHELMFDRNYMGGPRSDDFVLIAITAGRIRSTQTKRRFYKKLVECLAQAPGIQGRDVMVVINTTQTEDWSFANGVSLADLTQLAQITRSFYRLPPALGKAFSGIFR
jgi:phenylpyruvate tautomerase PptA (4-oxalocrotonate tautomerase family)